MLTLTSIDDYCGSANTPGLLTIQYIPIGWVSSFPDVNIDDHELNDALVLVGGTSWLSAKVQPESLRYKETQRNTEQGESYQQELVGELPVWRGSLAGLIQRMKQYRYILRVTDRDGVERILGTPEYPFRFSASLDTNGLKGHSIQFVAESIFKAYDYNI